MNSNTYFDILVFVLLIWFLISRFGGIKGLRNLTPEQFENDLREKPDIMLIDVREPDEVRQGGIPGAVNIPLSQLKNRSGEIPSDKPIYLYCRSGMRSKQAAKILLKAGGYRDFAHLQGGLMTWKGKITK